MLSIGHHKQVARREFLRVGGLALGGFSLTDWLATQAMAALPAEVIRDRSVVFLFLHGGPSQTETFDPKMTAPAGVRSATGETKTSIPGVTFGSTFSQLAALADQITIVRSFKTGDGKHDIKPIVGRGTADANLGSIYSRIAGTNHPHTGMPRNVALFPRAVDDSTQPGNMKFGNFAATGSLGSAYAPFMPGAGGEVQHNMRLNLPPQRLDDRKVLLAALDRIKRQADATGMLRGMDRFQQQAFDTIVGGVAKAFELSEEDPGSIARYDTAPLVRPENISRKWNNYNNYVDNAKTLGKLLLMARRLCESGCGFVTVTTNFVWDMHSDKNNAGVEEGMGYMGRPLDHALGAFLRDISDRGLSDKILLVVTGEMGRTPKLNNRGGRDHWGGIAPLLLAGGGLPMGQVIGQSNRDASEPQTEPVTIGHLIGSIMHSLIDIPALRLATGIPSDVSRVITGNDPIPGMHS